MQVLRAVRSAATGFARWIALCGARARCPRHHTRANGATAGMLVTMPPSAPIRNRFTLNFPRNGRDVSV
jgi:hypothetical protein